MLSSNPLKKMYPKKSQRPKTFAPSNKSKKQHFSVTFLITYFQHYILLQLFQRIQNQHQPLRF
jgi:hypothetical protein